MEEALYEIASMRRFAGFSLGSGSIPDETTILNFRHLLEANRLTEHIFALSNQYPLEQGDSSVKGHDCGYHDYRGAELDERQFIGRLAIWRIDLLPELLGQAADVIYATAADDSYDIVTHAFSLDFPDEFVDLQRGVAHSPYLNGGRQRA